MTRDGAFKSKSGKEVLVSLEENQLIASKSGRRGISHTHRILLENIIGTDILGGHLRRSSVSIQGSGSESLEPPASSKPPCLIIHYAETSSKKWTHSVLELFHSEGKVVASLRERILELLGRSHRPKRLLFFVNPFGGKRKAEEIFNKFVKPLLEISDTQYEMELTRRKNHALDAIMSRPGLEEDFDGVVSVGGDGMFGEVFNGVLRRSNNSPRLRVGIVPAGSTDALALSLHGSRDVLTCILHILLGDKRNVDVTEIHTENSDGTYEFEHYSMAMASYGYFGDLLKRSEAYRWMGPRRYDYAGFKTLLANRSYEGTISFLGKEENHSGKDLCTMSCRICENTPYIESDSRIKSQRVHGRFMAITAATLTCACEKTPNGISPYSHLGDGFSDLILVDKCSRLQYVNYLLRTGYKNTPNPFNLSFVRTYKVKEMTYSPLPSNPSVWNCDGELVSNPRIRLLVHCQILPVFARGILPKNAKPRKKFSFISWIFKKNRPGDQEDSSLVTS